MAAIRAGLLNNGLGQFHGGGYHRNANYQDNNRYSLDEKGDLSESDSDNSSENSSKERNQGQLRIDCILSVEKHKKLLAKKRAHIQGIEKTLKIIDTFICILGIGGVIIAQIETEQFYSNGNSPTSTSDYFRSIVTLSTILLILFILIHAKLDFEILKERREAPEEEIPGFFASNNFKILCIELIVNIIHCPPRIEYVFVSQQLGGTLTLSINEVCAA